MKSINLRKHQFAGTQMWLTEAISQDELRSCRYKIESYYATLPLSLPQFPGVIIDTSARCGIDAIYFAKRYPDCRIVALEANQNLFIHLKRNIEANLLENVTCMNVLVADHDSDVGSDVSYMDKEEAFLHRVRRVSLSSLLESLGMPMIHLLKIEEWKTGGSFIASLPNRSVFHVCGVIDMNDIWLPKLRRRLCEVSNSFDITIEGMADPARMRGKSDGKIVPDLTVILPVYNVEEYIEKCLLSIVSNTNIDMEILAVDDGSPDRSGEIIQRVAKTHSNIKHVVKANGGCASARNHGLRMAKGRYVTFVDSDDWVSSEGLSRAVSLSCLDNPDVVSFGYIKCYETEGTRYVLDGYAHSNQRDTLVTDRQEVRNVAYGEPSIWRKIYRRDFLSYNAIVFEDSIKRFDDLPFNFLVFMKASTMRVLPEAHYYYRLGREGQDVAITDSRLHTNFDIFNYLFDKAILMNDDDVMFRFVVIFISTHHWAWNLIDEKLKDEYLSLAKKQYLDLNLSKLCDITKIARFSKSHSEFIGLLKCIEC